MTPEHQNDHCIQCSAPALAMTPDGRMCGGHALVQEAREWNQGNWAWKASFDTRLTTSPQPTPQLVGA